MHIPLTSGTKGSIINPQTDSPIKKANKTKMNTEDKDDIKMKNRGSEDLFLKLSKNKTPILFITVVFIAPTDKLPKNMPSSNIQAKTVRDLLFIINALRLWLYLRFNFIFSFIYSHPFCF